VLIQDEIDKILYTLIEEQLVFQEDVSALELLSGAINEYRRKILN
jgi:hypothetical protein